MVVPASFVHLAESSSTAFFPTAFLLASDTVKRIGLVPLSATVRALSSIVDIQLLLAQVTFILEV